MAEPSGSGAAPVTGSPSASTYRRRMRTASRDAEDMAGRLATLIAANVPTASTIEVTGLHRTTGGQSRENWPFDVTWRDDDGEHDATLILRRDPTGSVLETEREIEHAVLVALESDASVPAPRSRWLDLAGEIMGRPSVVMDRFDGTCDHFVLEGGRLQLPLDDRRRLAERYCEIMAAIHRFDWRSADLDRLLPVPDRPAVAAIDHWTDVLRRHCLEPQPELLEVECWMRAHAPEAAVITLVHGDLKPGNSLLHQVAGCWDVQVMLDWETAHLGDPLEDVGWVTNPLRHREHQIPGVWQRDELIARYEALSGRRVDPAAVRFWSVLANYKLITIMLTGVRSFVDGRSERPWSAARGIMGFILRQIEEATA